MSLTNKVSTVTSNNEKIINDLVQRAGDVTLDERRGEVPGQGPPSVVQAPVQGAWSVSRTSAMKANNIMERTVVAKVPVGDGISRGNFLPALGDVIGLKNLVALGIAGSNREWHITTSDVTHAHSLVDCGSIQVGRESASLSFLRAPAFKIRIFWLPYYVDNQLVIDWLESFGMTVREARHEKSVIKGIEHVSTMVREFYVTKYGVDVKEELPDVGYVKLGEFRHRIMVAVQGRAVKCHRCGLRGHMRRECVAIVDVRPEAGRSPDPPVQGGSPDRAPDLPAQGPRSSVSVRESSSVESASASSTRGPPVLGASVGVSPVRASGPRVDKDGF